MTRNDDVRRLLHPKSIAIIGVSKDFSSIGGKPLNNLIKHQFEGKIYPVNPKYDKVGGYPCYNSILDVPGEVDVAIIAVSQSRVFKVFQECAQKNVKSLLLFGSGFAETGEVGEELQNELLHFAKENGISLIGPNCLGCLNVKDGIPLGFATSLETEKGFIKGNIAIASQSGALGFSVFGLAQEQNLGFTYVANPGNQMDIHTLDLLDFMIEDKETKVIAGYLEGIPDGDQLVNLANRAKELKKPLIILKGGRSVKGKKAAMSHTASLTGSDETFRAIAKQYGIVVVNDIDEMISAMKVFSRQKLVNGNRTVAISNSGASCIAMADFSEQLGLELIDLDGETKRKVQNVIPPYGSPENPIDITAQALKEQHILTDTLEVLAADDLVDIIVLQTTFGGQLGKTICGKIVKIDREITKPIIVTLTGREELTGEGRDILRKAGIPVFQTTYETMVAVKKLVDFSEFCQEMNSDRQQYNINYEYKVDVETKIWTEEKVKKHISQLGVRIPKAFTANSLDQTEKAADQLQFPVVAKVLSDDILHKTDAGGVKIGLSDMESLLIAYEEILQSSKQYAPNAEIRGVLIEEMAQEEGVEMFVGVKKDPQFGPVIVCGLGGIFVEVLKDVSIRRLPIEKRDALKMICELKGYPILQGIRGRKKSDVHALADVLVQISSFAFANRGTLEEMDLNPVRVLQEGHGVIALDGMAIWKAESRNETMNEK